MGEITIRLERPEAAYRPGEEVAGTATWRSGVDWRSLEIRLGWSTSGKGSVDTDVAARLTVANPARADERRFALRLPATPYSFSGKLVALAWSVEAVTKPKTEPVRVELVMGPGGRAVVLGSAE